MTRCDIARVFTMLTLVLVVGCSTNTDLGGSAVPNSRPDTRVTGQPPTLLEAGFSVEFNWTGTDPDGRVVGYQWKISDNGLDGISPRDTLTVDPLTGAEINPWRFTSLTDSTFIVSADQAGFPGDPEGLERSFRTHSFFIRAIDEKGLVDPTPAQISFTSTTIVPTCYSEFPGMTGGAAFLAPQTINLKYFGGDQDFESGIPTQVRFLQVDAEFDDGSGPQPIIAKSQYDDYVDELINFDDPNWTLWEEFAANEDERRISYSQGVHGKYYLFAIQVRDTAGAHSIGRNYSQQVLNYRVSENAFVPEIKITEYFLGEFTGDRSFDIPSGQPLNFTWNANAEAYSGNIVSMRHGWDLADVDDVNDPGWSVPPGMADQNRFSEEKVFSQGQHFFWIQVEDDSGAVRVTNWEISIIPFVAREFQFNLAFVDQVMDENSGFWPNAQGSISYDDGIHRDEYWSFLSGGSGVVGYSLDNDLFKDSDAFTYADLVSYKAVIITARTASAQRVFSGFRADSGVDKFVWLSPYQEFGGNVFLVGNRSMESFLEVRDYMVPIVFESTLEFYTLNDNQYIAGFGEKRTNSGEMIPRGPLMYPFATVGISALDWNVPLAKNIYGRPFAASVDRSARCSGLKEIRLVEEFRAEHLISSGTIASSIGTNPLIDWRDPMVDAGLDTMLSLEYPFVAEEFVDAMIAERPASLVIQDCVGGYLGKCIEPMFTGVTRIDWMRETIWENGNETWPQSQYNSTELDEICGAVSLTTYLGEDGSSMPKATALANGKNYGYLSYKTITDKPGGKADVYWGFDPFRFDRTEGRKAVLWVMEHFGLPLGSGAP